MSLTREKAIEIGKKYVTNKHIGWSGSLEAAGHGADGYVFVIDPFRAVIKVCGYQEKFERELAAYLRLLECGVVDVLGCAVPILLGHDKNLRVIEMTTVTAPYVLDFAQARLDEPEEFTEEVEQEWWSRVADAFGNDYQKARAVYEELAEKYGIYYYDLAPRNVSFGSKYV